MRGLATLRTAQFTLAVTFVGSVCAFLWGI